MNRAGANRGHRFFDCPECETPTLEVQQSDIDDNEIGLRHYMCKTCRRYFLSVESLFVDDLGNPDAFRALAVNLRLRQREHYRRSHPKVPQRRQPKLSDELSVVRQDGFLSVRYKRSKAKPLIYLRCKVGHDLTVEKNVYISHRKEGDTRLCRPCRLKQQREWLRSRNYAKKQQREQTAA